MRIKYGTTRIVLLIGGSAIKIGRVRPLRLLLRLPLLLFSRKRREHFYSKYGDTFFTAALRDVCAGLYANRNEYEYYQTCKDPRVMPTTAIILGGWIVLQPRGTPLSVHDVLPHPLAMHRDGAYEITCPRQFAKNISGRVVLIDYGRKETLTALQLG